MGMRTGDTPADERRRLARHPPDLLITTPESLYLMLTSAARETLVNVEAVIIDEIHALAATKRGSHLALTLERLDERCERPPQRIGLSATQRPLEEIATFLGGFTSPTATEPARRRPVTIVDAGTRKPLDLQVVVPVEDLGQLGTVIDDPVGGAAAAGPVRRSIWPAMHPKLLELVQEHRSTLIFVNARRLAERLATRLNELASDEAAGFSGAESQGAPPVDVELVKAHHGSLSRERRLLIEDELKSGRLKGLVATSSLELGIDMGAVDLVIQVESPGAVSRGLQRIGRAGHQVGEPSRGKHLPQAPGRPGGDRRGGPAHARGADRAHHLPPQPARRAGPAGGGLVRAGRVGGGGPGGHGPACRALRRAEPGGVGGGARPAGRALPVRRVRRAAPPHRVGPHRRHRCGVGRASQRLAVTSGGTIPDRGLYGVFLPDGTRVGELDEEMVYESRPGETFLLGASTWRIEDITHERVIVTPAPGQPGKMPFWHGDGPGRPLELGEAMGEFVREIRAMPVEDATARLTERHDLDAWAADNLLGYLSEQAEATGAVPDDRTIVVERFRDEIGDWRVCILSPFGAQVHAPWAMALRARLAERWGLDVELMWSDDGIVIRLPEAVDELPTDELLIDPDEIDEIVISQLPGTAMFAARFREAAGRALLLPRRRPDRRTPLWQQRQKAADLLAVAAKHPSFPILLEATRECLQRRVRPAGAAPGPATTCARARSGWWRSTPRRPRRWPSR